MKVYDATGKILGRLATVVAKQAIKGEQIHIVNCEKAIIVGDPEFTKKKYKQRIERGDPHHGPFYPKTPTGIVKRAIRGMIDYKKPTGRAALKRIKVWIGLPEEFKNKIQELNTKGINDITSKYITIGDLAISLGAKKRW
ncbi:MAG: 50S ribosomal protein L13 [Candidatus Aenigmatarchaeota archaeon]|nr:50S ribosomal protein L13 [Candidatus Aenigmarchaeota archaeon]